MMAGSQAELYDIGYQRYDGPREGRMRAARAVWVNGVRVALGLGRPMLAKVFPWLFLLFALLMSVVMTIIASLAEGIADIPGPGGYYQIVSFLLVLYAAVVAPELLCPDRRDGVISLYLVRPLTQTDYLAARWLAFFAITLGILYIGQATLFVGLTLASADAWDYVKDNWLDVPRFLGAGVLFAAFATTLPFVAAAFTTRRAYAAAFVIGLFVVSSVTAAILTECDEEFQGREGQFGPGTSGGCERLTGEAAKWFSLISIAQAPIHLNDVIFDVDNEAEGLQLLQELPSAIPVGWYLVLVAGPAAIVWWRYRRLRL